MSIKDIIKEAMAKNPVGMQEALEAALSERLAVAIEAKRVEMAEAESKYNADAVDKAIKSGDKNSVTKTTGKKKALIHALLKGHSK